jgi:isoamylase
MSEHPLAASYDVLLSTLVSLSPSATLPRRRNRQRSGEAWCMSRELAESLLPFQAGYVFGGRYRVDRLLARGGHGAVFVAEHLPTETDVALKVLWPHMVASDEDADCLELEAKVAGRVKSDFIVRVLDAGVDTATYTPFLAMELLEGRSLLRLIQDEGPLAMDAALRYLSHVAQGLDHAHHFVDKSGHRTPIVHRDLKPENLFLARREAAEPIVKILDFGVAKVLGRSVTTTASIRGTPAYMAFEQISGGALGPETDVWAFGLVAFFLLTGREYWRTASRADLGMLSLFAEVLHQPIVAPTERAREFGLTPNWPLGFDDWFLRCVAREPSARFGSAGAAIADLSARASGSLPPPRSSVVEASARASHAAGASENSRSERARASQLGNAPLGARVVGDGATFALFSQHASAVELCLFDPDDPGRETARIRVEDCTNHVWRVHVPNVRPGQLYGYRVHGAWDPAQGLRFNPHKLVLDPYARRLAGELRWEPAVFGHDPSDPGAELRLSERDSAPYVPKSVLTASAFEWGGDELPNILWNETTIYEAHVKGMTMRHPDVPAELRGTYLGLGSEPILEHFRDLGVTAVELLPVHHSVSECHLAASGLSNYWGYNPIGFFAPDTRYATRGGDPIDEFKGMVRALHAAGIEVLLDVVYNHTAEGDRFGPTLSFRGIDNTSYYRLSRGDRSRYEDFTGCGNSLSLLHPRALQLVLDSLRYWAVEMHVDGFRFDLLPTLARDAEEFDGLSRFLAAVQQDPALGRLKLIAEPWDLGPRGYQLGAFPPGFSEWNGRYRDTVRRFWRGDPEQARELSWRVAGSTDLFGASGRGIEASINYVTCHDGFTLEDLVSYDRKQNLANGHENQDGSPDEFSSNGGANGPSDDPEIRARRALAKRNLLATLVFSRGVPMLSHGDELGRSLGGNSNAYCHDTELNWLDWKLGPSELEFFEFSCEVLRIAREYPALRGQLGRGPLPGARPSDGLVWFDTNGRELASEDFETPELRTFAVSIRAAAPLREPAEEPGELLLLLLNGSENESVFTLPAVLPGGPWRILLDTARPARHDNVAEPLAVAAKSLVLLGR